MSGSEVDDVMDNSPESVSKLDWVDRIATEGSVITIAFFEAESPGLVFAADLLARDGWNVIPSACCVEHFSIFRAIQIPVFRAGGLVCDAFTSFVLVSFLAFSS